MIKNKVIGMIGEEIACGYLESIGHKIIDRNFMTKFGEIDIISKNIDKTLVFSEVKTLNKSSFSSILFPESYPQFSTPIPESPEEHTNLNIYIPEYNLTYRKINLFSKISQWYANKNPDLSRNGYRLDAIAIELWDSGHTLRRYKNIHNT